MESEVKKKPNKIIFWNYRYRKHTPEDRDGNCTCELSYVIPEKRAHSLKFLFTNVTGCANRYCDITTIQK